MNFSYLEHAHEERYVLDLDTDETMQSQEETIISARDILHNMNSRVECTAFEKYIDQFCFKLAQLIKVTISLSVLLSFGLAYYVPVIILWPMIESRVSPTSWGLNAFRLFGVTMSIILAIAVPYMVPLLGLLASFSMTSIMLLIPTVVDTATKWERATRLMCAKSICILVVYAVSLIFGSVESVIAINTAYGVAKEEGC